MALSVAKAIFLKMFCEAIFYGIRKPRKLRYASFNVLMLGSTALMFSLSTIHIALSLNSALAEFFGHPDLTFKQLSFRNPTVWLPDFIEIVNCVVGDIIVSWRTWVLWDRHWKVLLFPALCIPAVATAGLCTVFWGIFQLPPDASNPIESRTVVVGLTTWVALTTISNVYSVVMISWKTRSRLRTMEAMNARMTGGRYQSVLLVLIESGILYCTILIVNLALTITQSNVSLITSPAVVHVMGIYPTIIIVLVALQVSLHDQLSPVQTIVSTDNGTQSAEHHETLRQTFRRRLARLRSESVGAREDERGRHVDSYALKPIMVTTVSIEPNAFSCDSDRAEVDSKDSVIGIVGKPSHATLMDDV
ncbi:hypothetical protein C8Q80DRAFT_1342655 [Daedaleopsis nitida]|nr:hypothetical protein C8Q80DRAFT_1342655 [Daedaleopsis nitida]